MDKHIPWDLLIAHLKQDADNAEEQVLLAWRMSSEKNEQFYKEIVSLWDTIRYEASLYEPDKDLFLKKLEARINRTEQKKSAVTFSLFRLKMASVAASVILIMSVASSYLIGKHQFNSNDGLQTYGSLNGKSEITLPDGSLVRLNKGSVLTFKNSFLNDRSVVLTGEALFDVRHSSGHPFIVNAEGVNVRVHGTRFNVKAFHEDRNVSIALLRGKISVSASGREQYINPGEIACFNKTTNMLTVNEGDVGFASFWANDSYTFKARPLGEICRYLEQWYSVKIQLDNSIADNQVYTFTITDEPLETILQIMSKINPISYTFMEDNTVKINNVKN
jgi:ferric-dicitrate binding protein FerR (iron transport regulator)